MKKWTRWQDWVTGLAGLYTALSTIWTRQSGPSLTWMLIFGILLVIGALINLSLPGQPGVEWAELVVAALLFLAPWFGSYVGLTGAAWTSWIAGAIAVIAAALAIKPSAELHRHAPAVTH